jgi:translation initiation factor 2 subunit 1
MLNAENTSRRDEYPEPGEFVIATVQSIFKQGAFVTLEEYSGKQGMLPLSEISLKWVRNIRDYVREGQKVVLMVLGVNTYRGHIDLSLRRVTDAKRKEKLQQVKRKQRAEKLFEVLAGEMKVPLEEIKKAVVEILQKKYNSLYESLEAIASDEHAIDKLEIEPKYRKPLVELVQKSIKPPFVYITGYVEFKSYEPCGIDIIKESLKKIEKYPGEEDSKIEVSYISPPVYRIKVRAGDYKTAERVLKNASEEGIDHMRKNASIGEFHRKIEEIQK